MEHSSSADSRCLPGQLLCPVNPSCLSDSKPPPLNSGHLPDSSSAFWVTAGKASPCLFSAVCSWVSVLHSLTASGTSSWPEAGVKSEGLLILSCYIFNHVNWNIVAFLTLLDLTFIPNSKSIYEMLSYLAFSEESPCYEENMDWKIIGDNYFAFLNNLIKTPIASISKWVFRIQLLGLDLTIIWR